MIKHADNEEQNLCFYLKNKKRKKKNQVEHEHNSGLTSYLWEEKKWKQSWPTHACRPPTLGFGRRRRRHMGLHRLGRRRGSRARALRWPAPPWKRGGSRGLLGLEAAGGDGSVRSKLGRRPWLLALLRLLPASKPWPPSLRRSRLRCLQAREARAPGFSKGVKRVQRSKNPADGSSQKDGKTDDCRWEITHLRIG